MSHTKIWTEVWAFSQSHALNYPRPTFSFTFPTRPPKASKHVTPALATGLGNLIHKSEHCVKGSGINREVLCSMGEARRETGGKNLWGITTQNFCQGSDIPQYLVPGICQEVRSHEELSDPGLRTVFPIDHSSISPRSQKGSPLTLQVLWVVFPQALVLDVYLPSL